MIIIGTTPSDHHSVMESEAPPSMSPPGEVPPPLAGAIWALLAAMTRWEPLDAEAARERLRRSVRALDLSTLMGDPPAFPVMPQGTETFVLALEALRSGPRPARMLALRCALELALGGGSLSLSQNLVLRTVAEALGLGATELAGLFLERTGAGLPPLWDPSRPESWQGRDAGRPRPAGSREEAQPGPWDAPVPPGEKERIARIKALALLGLDEGAAKEEIRRAFLRISKVHHPDHYAVHGAEAAGEADRVFRRIKEAYDFLVKAES